MQTDAVVEGIVANNFCDLGNHNFLQADAAAEATAAYASQFVRQDDTLQRLAVQEHSCWQNVGVVAHKTFSFRYLSFRQVYRSKYLLIRLLGFLSTGDLLYDFDVAGIDGTADF